MSLTVPVTNQEVHGGLGVGYAPGLSGEAPSFTTAAAPPSSPSFAVGASAGSNGVAFGAAGWIALGLVGVVLLHQWGFRFAHVP